MSGGNKISERSFAFLPKGFLPLWALLWSIWLVANASIAPDVTVTGGLVALVVAYVFSRHSSAWQGIALTPTGIYHFIVYTAVFLRELVLANIDVMRRVYSPHIDIRPGVVRINTHLKSPIGRLALANSIALTPGSLVLDMKDDTLLVHWLDVKTMDRDQATRMIAGAYERHLEKVFG